MILKTKRVKIKIKIILDEWVLWAYKTHKVSEDNVKIKNKILSYLFHLNKYYFSTY